MRILYLVIFFLLFLSSSAFAANSFPGTGGAGYTVNNPNKGNTTTWTVCAWVKPGSLASDRFLFGYGQGKGAATGVGFDYILMSTGFIRQDNYSGSTNFSGTNSSNALVAGTWYHICRTRNGLFTNKYYLDGTEIANPAIDPPTVQGATDDFFIGTILPNTDAGWGSSNAEMSQLAYWDEELSAGQITSLANKSTCPSAISPAPEIFVKLDAVPATDSSTNAFSVTQNGTPTLTSDPPGLPCGSAPLVSSLTTMRVSGAK